MSTNRDQILNRIAALRARAEDAASSEAEIMAAVAKADALMQAYEIEEADLAMAEADGTVREPDIVHQTAGSHKTGRNNHKVALTLYAVQQFTGTKCVLSDTQTEFTGDKPDVEMACYLFGMIRTAMDRAYETYKRRAGAVGKGAKTSFQTAMAMRINERLNDLTRERQMATQAQIEAKDTESSRALVIVEARAAKEQAVEQAFRERNPRLGKARFSGSRRNGNAAQAGRAAGDRVGFGRPVGSGSAAARLA